jgi:DNA polymerase bacteriophage-type
LALTIEGRQALLLRLAGAKASIKKLPKILEQLSSDDRLRNQYSFYKAHTGRWAGKGAQMHNLKAPRTKEEKAWVPETIAMLEACEPVPSLDRLSMALRPLVKAGKGKKLVGADFKSVENRALAWASGCEAMMDVYRTCKKCDALQPLCKCPGKFESRDPYIDFAARMEGCDYSDVTAEMRQQAKPGTLGCGFGLGGGKLVRKCKCACKRVWNVGPDTTTATCPNCGATVTPGLPVKTGLWRYAEMMGIDLSQDQAQTQVEAFRTTFMEVASFWYYLEEAFAACVQKRRNQYINSSLGCKLTFTYKDPALRIVLPSGRELVYPNAFARQERTEYGGKKLVLGYEASRGHGWGVHYTYGGKLCENIIQAIGNDLLVDAMFRVDSDTLMEIVMHTHDEILTEADEKDEEALGRLENYMSMTEPWAVGLPMAADGFEGKRYGKG